VSNWSGITPSPTLVVTPRLSRLARAQGGDAHPLDRDGKVRGRFPPHGGTRPALFGSRQARPHFKASMEPQKMCAFSLYSHMLLARNIS
jgi:hypothetical protein